MRQHIGTQKWRQSPCLSCWDAWNGTKAIQEACLMPSDILTGCISGSVGAMGVYLLNLVRIWLLASRSSQHPSSNTSLWSSCLQMPYIGCDDGALHNLAQHCASPHHCVWPSVTMSPCVTLCRHVTMLVFLWLSEEVVVVSKGAARVMCRLYYQ